MSSTSDNTPIFVATHPRSCSTAFERVFMTRTEDLKCLHEPFGDPFYYGPERMSSRYDGEAGSAVREKSGYEKATYQSVLDEIESSKNEGKRIFIKDMACYLVPPTDHRTVDNAEIPASVLSKTASEPNGTNGTSSVLSTDGKRSVILPLPILQKFKFAILIRNPRRSVPSYYRCCIPPLSEMTGFDYFMPNEAGYRELRVLFDYLREQNEIKAESKEGSKTKGYANGDAASVKPYEVCIIDADDLLDHPKEVIEKFCEMVGLSFDEGMLEWGANKGCESFDKWKGFHEDAIGSSGLKPRTTKKIKTREQEYEEWVEKYGKEAAEIINKTADDNMADYEYLKQFAIQV